MILEGLISTLNADGTPHVAPMGPRVDGPNFDRFLLRPFPTSHTYRNLARHPEGVLHVTDDVLLLAKASVGKLTEFPPHRPAEQVRGVVLTDACRYFEFRVDRLDDSEERVRLDALVVHAGHHRDFFGFNRAKHAVLEAAILATRLHLLPRGEIEGEFRKLRTIVDKTGGAAEHEAMAFLEAHLAGAAS